MSWFMYASIARRDDDGPPLRHFGPLGYAVQDRTAVGFVEVELRPDPNGAYWAWLDLGGAEPILISGSERDLAVRFRAGDASAPGPYDEQALGQGEVLRLAVTILQEVPVAGRRSRIAVPDWPVLPDGG